MRASELIKELQEQIEAHGDIDVVIDIDWMDCHIESVEFCEQKNHICISHE